MPDQSNIKPILKSFLTSLGFSQLWSLVTHKHKLYAHINACCFLHLNQNIIHGDF